MEQLRAILVDDEENARDVLENLLNRFCPEVKLLAKCSNVNEAVTEINNLKPDLVFVDIEMPNYSGLELVKFFDKVNFHIVFVTAYDNYALKAFEVSAIDYLLKPIDIDRLKQTVQRVKQICDAAKQAERMNVLGQTMEQRAVKNIVVIDRGQQVVVPIDQIIAIEAREAYSLIHTPLKKYTVSKNLKHFENLLEGVPGYIRVHKSWLINKSKLVSFSKSELSIKLNNNVVAKLSRYKINEFESMIHS